MKKTLPSLITAACFAIYTVISTPETKANTNLQNADWSAVVKNLTIGIKTPAGSGSGVIIGRKGNIYTALTARHVIPTFNQKDEYEVYSPNTREHYRITNVDYLGNKDVDIMAIQFESNQDLKIAVLNIFYNEPNNLLTPNSSAKSWNLGTDGIRGGGISMSTEAVTVPIFRYTSAVLQERAIGNKDGYELLYKASTVPGMSGGPIVGWRDAPCSQISGYFSLIAIHGRSEGYEQGGGRSGISLGVPIDLISSQLSQNAKKYGIPVMASDSRKLAAKNYCKAKV